MAKNTKSKKRRTSTKGKKKSTRSKGKSKTSRRKRSSSGLTLPDLSFLLHPTLWAILLFMAGLLTLGTFASSEPGTFLAWWRGRLRLLVGGAIYLVPIAAFATSWWLLRYVTALEEDEEPAPPTLRVTGLMITLAAVAAFLHLMAFTPDPLELAQQGKGGGIVGFVVSDFLVRNLGFWMTLPILTVILLVGVLMALAATPGEVILALRRVRAQLAGRPMPEEPLSEEAWEPIPTIEPVEPREPWWRKLWHRLRPPKEEPLPTRIIGQEPADTAPVVSPYTPIGEEATSLAEPPSPAEPQQEEVVSPRPSAISPATPTHTTSPVGSDVAGQEWLLPDIRAIFEDSDEGDISEEEIRQRSRIIEETLAAFGVPVRVVEVNRGPTVTQFGVQPGYIERVDRKTGTIRREKVKVSRIVSLQNDLALALAAAPIRIEAPVPGKPIVGIEVPNKRTALVTLRSVLESDVWRTFKGRLKIALGQDVAGRPVVADLARMPHLLIAGATGSGKSVCINAIISCLMATHTPEEVRFILVDPKRVELTVYNGVPHLIGNVLTDVDLVVTVLQWAVREMERRYEMFSKERTRDIVRYNRKMQSAGKPILPYIIIVVDELADLMLSAPDEVERAVVRLAQMARATGIHLVLATQRPSVDVVTGLIKANFPARIAFAVTSQVDSRVILDSPGAEQLLGQGDMLFLPPDSSKLARLQGVFVSDREIQRLVEFWRKQKRQPPGDEPEWKEQAEAQGADRDKQPDRAEPGAQDVKPEDWEQRPLLDDLLEEIREEQKEKGRDPLFDEAVRVVREANRASISLLQRRLRIGYARAGRLIDELEAAGIIGPDPGGGRSRRVYPPKDDMQATPADGEQ